MSVSKIKYFYNFEKVILKVSQSAETGKGFDRSKPLHFPASPTQNVHRFILIVVT